MYIPTGVKEAVDILNKSTQFLVYGDPDIDGLVAGSFVIKLLNDSGKTCVFYQNENRAHGFLVDREKLEKYKGYTIIAVDFAIPTAKIQEIVDTGINIINIDHHDIEETELVNYSNNGFSGVVINNQYEFEPKEERYLSGAGMVYHTFAAMFPDYMQTTQNRALVGMTLLSDVRIIENNRAMEYLKELYHWQDDYSKYLISITRGERSYSFGEQRYLDRNYMDYTFSPKFNALFRLNMGDVAVKLFNRIPVDINLGAVRGKQKDIEADLLNKLTPIVESDVLTVMSVDVSEYANQSYNIANFIGLVCGDVKNDRGTTVFLMVRDGDKIIRGSVRGNYDSVNYRTIFTSLGAVGAGHMGAFGVRECLISQIDFNGLIEELRKAEASCREAALNDEKVKKVQNLGLTVMQDVKKEIAIFNNYVRDVKRVLYDCSSCRYKVVKESQTSSYIEYNIDGVTVKCFDKSLTPENGGYVMPCLVNGYVEYYLRKRSI